MNPKTTWAVAAALTLGTPLAVRAQQYMWYDPAHSAGSNTRAG